MLGNSHFLIEVVTHSDMFGNAEKLNGQNPYQLKITQTYDRYIYDIYVVRPITVLQKVLLVLSC